MKSVSAVRIGVLCLALLAWCVRGVNLQGGELFTPSQWMGVEGAQHVYGLRKQGKPFKVVVFLRHGESEANVVEASVGHDEWYSTLSRSMTFLDPPLTPFGMSQARVLEKELRGMRVEKVISSPLTRTLQTSMIAFNGSQPWAPRIEAMDEVRAILGVQRCNQRRSTRELKAEFPFVHFDSMDDEDTQWSEEIRESDDQLMNRADDFLQWLWHTRESTVAVVSHHGFIGAALTQLGLIQQGEEEKEGGGMFGEISNSFIGVVVVELSPNSNSMNSNSGASTLVTVGKAFIILAALKLAVVVFIYYLWGYIKAYLWSSNVSYGPQEGDTIDKRRIAYARVPVSDPN